jgi:multidrug efflux pump subunit AcrA (membrane-fusion protein)
VHHDRRLEQELPREKRQKEIAKDREALNLEKTRESLPVSLAQKLTEVEKLKHALYLANLKLKRMQQDEQLLKLTSPIDGVVVYGQAEYGKWTTTEAMRTSLRPGGSITPHQVIMTIIPDQGASLWVEIPEKHIGTCQVDQQGEFFPTAYAGSTFPCHLKGFTRVFAKEGIFSGEVDLDTAKDELRQRPLTTGMTGKVRLVQFSAKDVITVPSSAVFTEDENPNQHYVYVSVEGTEPRQQPVEIGFSSVTKTHIKSGLQAGDKILLTKPEGK